ncbi:unnamed protein product [Dicrocoelium dendriticum]|nr:unnamed protein product [Dicrocoelium dendriticum]
MNTAMQLLFPHIFLLIFSAMTVSASPFMDGLFDVFNQVSDTGDDVAHLSVDRPFDGEQRSKANIGFSGGMKERNLKDVKTNNGKKLGEHLGGRAKNLEGYHLTPQRKDDRLPTVTEQRDSPQHRHYGAQFDSQRSKHPSASNPEIMSNAGQAPVLSSQVTEHGGHLKKQQSPFRGFNWLDGLMFNDLKKLADRDSGVKEQMSE